MKIRNLVVVAALVLNLPGCGGGGDSSRPTTPSTPAPTPPPRTVLPTLTFNLAPNAAAFADVDVTAPSVTFEATADWTFASNDVDIYISDTTCTNVSAVDLFGGRCRIFAQATSATTKPERVSFVASAGRYRTLVANFGPTSESGTFQVILTGR